MFNSSYGQGSGPIGVNVLDTVGIGSASLQSLQFGNAYDEPGLISLATGDNVQGIMGISFEAGEAQVAFERKKPYTNVVGALKEEGYINTMGYSLFLDSQGMRDSCIARWFIPILFRLTLTSSFLAEASSGSILFGGVDTSKYTGDLVSLDIVPPFVKGTPPSMTVQLTGISASYSDADNVLHTASLTSDSLIPVILDSGTTDIQLSPPLVNAMSRFMGAVPIPANPGFGYVPCNLSTANASFTFTLGGAHGVNITAPMSEMVFDWQGDFTFADGTRACQIGVDASEPYILGDSFLRSAYAVFNLESKQIGLAQAAVRASTAISSSGTILEIPPSGIPSAVRSVPVLSIPSSISLSHPPQSSPTAIDEGEGGGRGGRKHKHPFPFPSSFSSAINATTTENPATTLTVGTVDVLPSHASFTATGAAPLEPSVYLEAARIAGAPPASGGGGVNTTTTAAGTGAAMPTGAGMGSVVSAYSSSSNGYRGVMYAAGSGRLGVMVGVVGWAVWGAGL